jgi:hypothetical protein
LDAVLTQLENLELWKGASDDRKTMTIESCIDFCFSKGLNVAGKLNTNFKHVSTYAYTFTGLEYSTQCFCDNAQNISADRKPVTGPLQDCSSPCAGNPNEVCGGGGLISMYQKCSAGSCANPPLIFINGSYVAPNPVKTAVHNTVHAKAKGKAKHVGSAKLVYENLAFGYPSVIVWR